MSKPKVNTKLAVLLVLLLFLEVAPGYALGQLTSAALGDTVPAGLPGGGSGSLRVVYASTITGAIGGQAVTPGSSATGDTDSAAALNALLAAGNTKLILDSGYALKKPGALQRRHAGVR
jgi:hypothetical protein